MSHSDNKKPVLIPLPALCDNEEEKIPQKFSKVCDGHVHLFPDLYFEAIWLWFDRFGWPVRYKLFSENLLEFLFSHGVEHIIGLSYAHKPGLASDLNNYMAALQKKHKNLTGLATLFPGEEGVEDIFKEASDLGLKGIKLHCHVQGFEVCGSPMIKIYEECCRYNWPIIMHIGREPKSEAYKCDPYELCRVENTEWVLKRFRNLKVCIPHLGSDEYVPYLKLAKTYDNLWLDTTMMLADYFPGQKIPEISEYRPDRLIYGSDFPNLPYAWDRELKKISTLPLSEQALERLLVINCKEFYGF